MTERKQLERRLVKIKKELDRAHEKEFDARVGTMRYWKMSRKIDLLCREKDEIESKLKE